MTAVPPVGSHYWTVADDGTPSCLRCGCVKRPENARMRCWSRPDGIGSWTMSLRDQPVIPAKNEATR